MSEDDVLTVSCSGTVSTFIPDIHALSHACLIALRLDLLAILPLVMRQLLVETLRLILAPVRQARLQMVRWRLSHCVRDKRGVVRGEEDGGEVWRNRSVCGAGGARQRLAGRASGGHGNGYRDVVVARCRACWSSGRRSRRHGCDYT